MRPPWHRRGCKIILHSRFLICVKLFKVGIGRNLDSRVQFLVTMCCAGRLQFWLRNNSSILRQWRTQLSQHWTRPEYHCQHVHVPSLDLPPLPPPAEKKSVVRYRYIWVSFCRSTFSQLRRTGIHPCKPRSPNPGFRYNARCRSDFRLTSVPRGFLSADSTTLRQRRAQRGDRQPVQVMVQDSVVCSPYRKQ